LAKDKDQIPVLLLSFLDQVNSLQVDTHVFPALLVVFN
jgi:hypothetical protein